MRVNQMIGTLDSSAAGDGSVCNPPTAAAARFQGGITHVIAGLAKEVGGPSYSVPALAAAQARAGTQVWIRSVGGRGPGTGGSGVNHSMHPSSAGPMGRVLRASPQLRQALDADACAGKILHVHGLWLMPNIYPAWVKRRLGGTAKIVHAPRGMLGRPALEISGWKKKPLWWLLQRATIEAADCLHATATSEYEEIRAIGLTNPVAIIPNGIDLPDLTGYGQSGRGDHVVLSLGRIHPKKGLDRLVRAWAYIEADFPNWRLRIVGPPEVDHDKELRKLTKSMGLERVSIEEPIYEPLAKLTVYREADVFVLPTLNENFAMTIAEALAAATPVITTKGAPWSGLVRERCGWWIDHGIEALADALRSAMQMADKERHAMGLRGRAWMARDFGWDSIAAAMLEVYRWVVAGGDPPANIQLD